MSDTPKTDELAKREFVADGVWIRHARELERENAALRKWVKEESKRNDVCTYGILKEVCEECRCEKRKEAQP